MHKPAKRSKLTIRQETIANLATVNGGLEPTNGSFQTCPPNGLTCFQPCGPSDPLRCSAGCPGTAGTCDGCTLITF